MSRHADEEALFERRGDETIHRRNPSGKGRTPVLSIFGRLSKSRGLPRLLIVGGIFFLLLISFGSVRHGKDAMEWAKDKYRGTKYEPQAKPDDLDLSLPPRYLDLKEAQKNLPQHDLSLPYPEGATGRYVKFTSQINMLGWNNVLNELFLLLHLAYKSQRAYVFQDYIWKQEYYPWPEDKAWEVPSHTPLGALLAGPIVGGPWEDGDPAPRSIHESHWEVVCPQEKRKVIWTHHVKKEHGLHWIPTAKQIFAVWNKILLEEDAQCVEVIAPPRDVEDFGQVFDLWLVGVDRVLDIWEDIRDSPTSRLLRTSPVIERAVARNLQLFKDATVGDAATDPFSRVFAVHIRRGDYIDACTSLANWNSTFYSWNLHPWLPDRFGPLPGGERGKNTPENIKEYFVHCLPDVDQIIKRITGARDDYEKEVFGGRLKEHYITTLYILTNAKADWLKELADKLQKAGNWKVLTSRDIVFGDSQEKDVGMAVDMELARKAAIFMGNGWSSFTSNILHRRLVDAKIPIANRFF